MSTRETRHPVALAPCRLRLRLPPFGDLSLPPCAGGLRLLGGQRLNQVRTWGTAKGHLVLHLGEPPPIRAEAQRKSGRGTPDPHLRRRCPFGQLRLVPKVAEAKFDSHFPLPRQSWCSPYNRHSFLCQPHMLCSGPDTL